MFALIFQVTYYCHVVVGMENCFASRKKPYSQENNVQSCMYVVLPIISTIISCYNIIVQPGINSWFVISHILVSTVEINITSSSISLR